MTSDAPINVTTLASKFCLMKIWILLYNHYKRWLWCVLWCEWIPAKSHMNIRNNQHGLSQYSPYRTFHNTQSLTSRILIRHVGFFHWFQSNDLTATKTLIWSLQQKRNGCSIGKVILLVLLIWAAVDMRGTAFRTKIFIKNHIYYLPKVPEGSPW